MDGFSSGDSGVHDRGGRGHDQSGVKPEDIMVNYTPFGFSDWTSEVSIGRADREVRSNG